MIGETIMRLSEIYLKIRCINLEMGRILKDCLCLVCILFNFPMDHRDTYITETMPPLISHTAWIHISLNIIKHVGIFLRSAFAIISSVSRNRIIYPNGRTSTYVPRLPSVAIILFRSVKEQLENSSAKYIFTFPFHGYICLYVNRPETRSYKFCMKQSAKALYCQGQTWRRSLGHFSSFASQK